MAVINATQSELATIAAGQSATRITKALQAEALADRIIVDHEDFASAPLSYGIDAITGLQDRFTYALQSVIDTSAALVLLPVPDHDGVVSKPYPKKHKYNDLIAPELHRTAKLRKDLITALQDGSYLPDLLGPSNKTVQIQRRTPPELPQLSSPPVQVGDLSRVIVSLRQSPDDDEEAMEALLRVL